VIVLDPQYYQHVFPCAVEGVGGLLATPKVADQAADLTISGRFRALTTRVQQQPSCDRFSGG
jgi:hypothetical protein